MKTLKDRTIKGVLLDITGVLVESSAQGDGTPVPGSIEAVQALRDGGMPAWAFAIGHTVTSVAMQESL